LPFQKKAVDCLSDLIEKFPPMKASEFYFNKIVDDKKKKGYGGDEIELVLGPFDNHDGWDEVPEEQRAYIEGKVKALIEKAVRHADSRADGWGTIPAEIREEIRQSVSTYIDWRNVLRQFVGSIVRGSRSTTIKRINKRFPYIHPGVKKGYTAKLLVAIDQSGSVGDEMLEMFFAELETLTRKVDVSVIHFDCVCNESDLYEWKKGTRPKHNRTRTGGTDFDAPTNFCNAQENRGRWDGMLIMTDGQAHAPAASRIKRGWILGMGQKLNFSSDEIQIQLSDERQMSGAWR
jgi:predicted metal-dependent peptidase